MHESVRIPGAPELAADLYLPDGARGPVPGVVTGPGFGGVKEMLIPHFGEALAQAGIATLAVDYAGFGASGGEPRQDVDPRAQIRDLRRGLDHLSRDARIDARRLGIFGTSMSGAHALVIAGTDPRIRAAVVMVPFVRAPTAPPSGQVALALLVDTLRRALRLPSRTIPAAGPPGSHAVMTSDGALEWLERMASGAPTFRIDVTVRSLARVGAYRPMRMLGAGAIRIPLRSIVSTSDSITPAALARAELKGVDCDHVEFPGTHFELFDEHLARVIRSTVEWFEQHLSVVATHSVAAVQPAPAQR
jgi:dienelactone hydrolase